MATIEPRRRQDGSLSYRVRIRVAKARHLCRTFRRLTDARAWAAEKEAQVRRGASDSPRATLGDAIAYFRAEELHRLAPVEQPNRERHLTWWLKALGSHTPLAQVTRGVVRAKLDALRPCGLREKPLTAATILRYRNALSSVLSLAVELEWLPANPLHSSSRRRRPKAERPNERERELLPAEKARLWDWCRRSREKRLYPLAVCAYASGAREGELMGLEWQHVQLNPVDFDPAEKKEVPGSPRALVLDTKTGEDRMIYFPGEAGELLRQIARQPRLSRFVFAGPADPPSVRPVFPSGSWRYAKKKAQVEDFRFHDLRHCWACNLLDSGATLPQLMILGGWKSSAMVRRYTKRAQRRGSAAVEAMAQRGLL